MARFDHGSAGLQHAYILKKDVPEAFATLKEAIGMHGFLDEFAGQPQVYLLIGRHKYWAYETVLNREDVQLTLARQAKRILTEGQRQKTIAAAADAKHRVK